MTAPARLLVPWLCCGFLCCGNTADREGAFVDLKERFGVSHPEQVVELPLSKPLTGGSWLVRDEAGAMKPCQLLSGGQRLALQTDLPAGESRRWEVVSGQPSAAPRDPITITTSAEGIEIANSLVAVRLPLSGAAANGPSAPAPLQALRMRSGPWMGSGERRITFAGGNAEARVNSIDTRVVEGGPLLAIVDVIYQLERPEIRYGDTVLAPKGPGRYVARFRMEAGQPSVVVTEDTDTQFAWSLDLSELRVDQGRYRGHHASDARWGVEPDGKRYRPAHERGQIDALMDLPFDRHYLPGPRMSSQDGLFRRLPAWDPWITDGGWYWQFYAKDGGPDSPLLGLFGGRASVARDVGEAGAGLTIHGATRTIGLASSAQHRTDSGHVQRKPRFQWGIFAGTKTELRPPEQVQPIARQMNLHAGFNLTKLAAVPADFPDPPQGYGSPFMSRAAADRLRAAVRADAAGLHGDGPIGQLGRKDPQSRELIEFWAKSSPEARAKIIQRAELLAHDLVSALVHDDGIYNYRLHYWLGGLEMSRMLVWIDQVLGSEQLSTADRAKLKAAAALFAAVLWDNDFVPLDNHHGINLGTPNMPVQQAGYRDQYAVFMAADPVMRQRATAAAQRVSQNLRADINEHGSHLACVHYIGASMGPTLTLMQQFQQAGLKDFFRDEPRLTTFAEFLMQCTTPPEPRFGGLRKQIAVGDSANESSELFGQLGTAFAPSNPKLSQRLMGMWRAQGAAHSSFHGTTALKIDDSLPSEDAHLASASFPGYFTVLRSGWGTSRESAAWLLTGNHYVDHAHADEGEVILYAHGAPISLDWGSMYEPRSYGAVMHSVALPERMLEWPWDKDAPPVSAGGELWGNYPGTRTTIEAFRSDDRGAWVRSRMSAPDKSFTWTRALTSVSVGEAASVFAIQDAFSGDGAKGARVFTLNLCADGEVETPAGKITPIRRIRGYGVNQAARRENPSAGAPFALLPGVNRFRFTGQHWPKHSTGGIDFDVFVISDQPQQASIGNWAHAWHPGYEALQFEKANGLHFEERQHILRIRGEGGFQVIVAAWPKGKRPNSLTLTPAEGRVRIAAGEDSLTVHPDGSIEAKP